MSVSGRFCLWFPFSLSVKGSHLGSGIAYDVDFLEYVSRPRGLWREVKGGIRERWAEEETGEKR